MCLRVGRQDSQIGAILARFLEYYQFRDPEVISTIDEHRGAFTCQSSKLTILADSGMFCALLLTILGFQSDFHD